MPRRPRLHVPGGFYHVTMRGNHRQDIFFSDEHRDWLEQIVAEVIERFAARVHAYCWMTNHIHLLIQISELPLGAIMMRIASRYARRVQGRFQTTGHLFEKRHDAQLVDADEYLLTLLRYIHQNPVRAGIVNSVRDYRWSSHSAYLGTVSKPWVTTDFALAMFGAERNCALAAFVRFVEARVIDNRSPLDELNPDDPRILGDDRFAARVLQSAWRPKSRKTLDEVVIAVCTQFAVTQEQLQARGANRRFAQARACIASRCIDERITSLAEVARRFGRDESTLRESIERYRSKR
jgi:putative transposase